MCTQFLLKSHHSRNKLCFCLAEIHMVLCAKLSFYVVFVDGSTTWIIMIIDSLFCWLIKWFVELSKPFEEHIWGEQPLINIYSYIVLYALGAFSELFLFFVFTPDVDIVLTKIITGWWVSMQNVNLFASENMWKSHFCEAFGRVLIVDWLVVTGTFGLFSHISNPNWLIFFRGVGQPSTRYTLYHIFL